MQVISFIPVGAKVTRIVSLALSKCHKKNNSLRQSRDT